MALLFAPDQVVELRCPGTAKGTISGYFDDFKALKAAADKLSGTCPGVYVTLNPVNPALLARAKNRLQERAKSTTTDTDITCRRWLPLDFDPKRPVDISSTDQEHQAALERAQEVARWLAEQGWPEPIQADSGNGAHTLYRIDLPNDAEATRLVDGCLKAIALRFGDCVVDVDVTTKNPARIWKLYGTKACKGDNTLERPHRIAKILSAPKIVQAVRIELLEGLANTVPKPPARTGEHYNGRFDLEEWITKSGLPIASEGSWDGSGRKWIFEGCPWNPAHTNRSAYLLQFANGAIAAGCHHNSCQDFDWHALRKLVEPSWEPYEEREDRPQRIAARIPQLSPAENGQGLQESATPSYPKPPDGAAYYGLAGDIVRASEPHTEADPVALLVQVLVGFGNLVGAGTYYTVEAAQHPARHYAVLVGESSKARKGSSWRQVANLLRSVDPEWGDRRVLAGLSSGEGVIWAVRDPIEQQEPIREGGKRSGRIVRYEPVVTDAGVEDKRLLILESEYASVLRILGRDGNTLSAVIRQAWDEGNLRTLTKNSPAVATGAHISMIGHITREELLRYLNSTEQGNGFANRYLWLAVHRSKTLPEGGAIEQVDFGPLIRRLTEAAKHGRNRGRLQFDAVARQMWHEVYPDLSAGKPGLLGAVTARGEAHVVRLALTYALLDCADEIRDKHLEAALALWEYCERSAAWIFGDATGDPVGDRILTALRQAPEGLTRTQIRDLFGRNQSADRINHAVESLAAAGRVIPETVDTGGRPAERFKAAATTTETT